MIMDLKISIAFVLMALVLVGCNVQSEITTVSDVQEPQVDASIDQQRKDAARLERLEQIEAEWANRSWTAEDCMFMYGEVDPEDVVFGLLRVHFKGVTSSQVIDFVEAMGNARIYKVVVPLKEYIVQIPEKDTVHWYCQLNTIPLRFNSQYLRTDFVFHWEEDNGKN